MRPVLYDPLNDPAIYNEMEARHIRSFEDDAGERLIDLQEYIDVYPNDNYPSRFKTSFINASKIATCLKQPVSLLFCRLAVNIDPSMDYVDGVLALAEAQHNLDQSGDSNKTLESISFKEARPNALQDYVRTHHDIDYRILGHALRIGKWLSDALENQKGSIEGIIADQWEDACQETNIWGDGSRAAIVDILKETWVEGPLLHKLRNTQSVLLEMGRYQPQ